MATSTTMDTAPATADAGRRVAAGAAGGVLGGLVFGAMMQVMDMIPMVAMLVDSESLAVGWAVHLAISLLLGAGFGLLAGRGLDSWGTGLALGVGFGVVWWVLGALIAMPAGLGMPTLQLTTMAWQSLMGHVVFGAVLGAVCVGMLRTRNRG